MEAAGHGERPPDLVIRGDKHVYWDTGPCPPGPPSRVIQLPCWQISTEYGHKIKKGRLVDLGGIIVTLTDRITVEPILYRAERSVWKG
jgi:hypothetical protein